ncbi:MAG: TonB-dependent receptor plug domain-containing protein [Gemmatimonadetes bacterium]|nr:TonB-dependent receptor plug domain-containing protein [Gemmatimonadota bacterium]NNM32837.1 TonB-dependent receptor plug domain-containing protein [Gemmatimonadota bacterium]
MRARTRSLERGALLLCVALGVSIPEGLTGQVPQSLEPVTFTGRVIDTYWGDPVVEALVRVDGTIRPDGSQIWGLTREDGTFIIPNVPPGPSQVTVTRLGYADLVQVLDIRADQFVEVVVIPKPVVLEGIEVYVDRLESRVRQLPYAVATFDEVALKLSPTMDVATYLDQSPNLEFVPCFENNSGGGVFRQRRDCMRARGTQPRRPQIFIDDAPAFGGLPELATIPTTEVYRVEVIRGCGQIRVYTSHYVERVVGQRARPLIPILC